MSGYTKLNDECVMFRKLMSAYIDDQTGEAETRSLSDHVASCPSCKRELANLYVMRDMIRSSYAPKGEVDFSAAVMARINPVKRAAPAPVKKIGDRALRYGVAAALLFAALSSTVLYSQSKTRSMMAEKRKFDTYMVEHAEQYAGSGGAVAASVISVNFEK